MWAAVTSSSWPPEPDRPRHWPATLLDASATTFTLTGGSFVEVSSGATLAAPAAAPLTALSGGALNLGGGTGFR